MHTPRPASASLEGYLKPVEPIHHPLEHKNTTPQFKVKLTPYNKPPQADTTNFNKQQRYRKMPMIVYLR